MNLKKYCFKFTTFCISVLKKNIYTQKYGDLYALLVFVLSTFLGKNQ